MKNPSTSTEANSLYSQSLGFILAFKLFNLFKMKGTNNFGPDYQDMLKDVMSKSAASSNFHMKQRNRM